MYIFEVTFRHRNDFHFNAFCRHCRKTSFHGDGYADRYYQEEVFPHRFCEYCGLDEYGNGSGVAQSVERSLDKA